MESRSAVPAEAKRTPSVMTLRDSVGSGRCLLEAVSGSDRCVAGKDVGRETPPSPPAAHRPVVPRIVYESSRRSALGHGTPGPQRTGSAEFERRRPSAPAYLVAPPRHAEPMRRASAQADSVWTASTSCGYGSRGSSELGSGASLHALAERLAQPLPSRRCSLLDDRTRRLSRFADESVGLAGAAAAKRRARRLVAGVGLLILVTAVALIGFSLTMSSRIDELIRKENEEIYRGLKPSFNQTTTAASALDDNR